MQGAAVVIRIVNAAARGFAVVMVQFSQHMDEKTIVTGFHTQRGIVWMRHDDTSMEKIVIVYDTV